MAFEIGGGGDSSPNPININPVVRGIGGGTGGGNSDNPNRDKLIEKYKEIIKNNLDNFHNIIGDNGGGDNGGYIDNPIVEPEAQEPEAVEAQPEEQTAKQNAVEIEPVAGLLQENNETKEEVKDNTFSVADVFAPKATQANEDYTATINNSQNAGKGKEATATDWVDDDDEKKRPPSNGLLVGTNVELPENYDAQEAKSEFGNTVAGLVKNANGKILSTTQEIIQDGILGVADLAARRGFGSPTLTDSSGEPYKIGVDLAGNVVMLKPSGIGYDGYLRDPNTGAWVPATYDSNNGVYSITRTTEPAGNPINGAPLRTNTETNVPEFGSVNLRIVGENGVYIPASTGNNTSTASITTDSNSVDSNAPYTTDVGTTGNPISDVQVGDTAIHYVDKEGAIHSVPLSTEEGQAVLDNYFDIDPTEVTVGDTTVSYFDENGDYHVVPLASEKGQEIQKYADAMGDYGSIEANYAKAIEAVGEYNTNNSYLTVGTTDNPINADELINTIADMKVNPMYAGWTDEQIRAEAVRIIQSRFDQTNGKPFSWSEDLPLIEGVPLYNTETGTGNALYDSIMNDGRTVSGFSSQEDITYQDSILHYFDNPEYSNGGGLPTENGAGFRGVVIPESCQDIVATSKYGALDERNGDKIETVVMSDEKYTEAVLDFVEANPQISAMLEAGKLTLDGIIAHFFKLNTAKPSGGSSYRGYGGYYRGGGGGGYRSYGGSSGGSSNSAGSTTQNQQRVYNIMKNWSF